jgi:hypothetical protein
MYNLSKLASAILVLLVGGWMWIAGGTLLAGGVTAALTLSQPREFTAGVDIVPNRARTQVSYDLRIRTSSDASQQANAYVVTQERKQGLAQLVRNPDVEHAVRTALGERLPTELRTPGAILARVRGILSPRSDVITISVDGPTRELAEDLAAAWAKAYERSVNQLYADAAALQNVDIDARVKEALALYNQAETALATFQATSQLGEYARQLESKQQILNDRLLFTAELSRVARRVDVLLQDALALQQQLAAARDNSSAASNAAAVTLLKTQAFTEVFSPATQIKPPSETSTLPPAPPPSSSSNTLANLPPGSSSIIVPASPQSQDTFPPGGGVASQQQSTVSAPANAAVQHQLPVSTGAPATLDQQRADMAATIQALTDWRTRLRGALQDPALLERLLVDTEGSSSPSIGQVEQQVRDLQGKVTEERAKQRNLVQARDVALETYTSLQRKAEEARVTRAIGAGNEVSIVNQRVIAVPKSRGAVVKIAFAAAIGAAAATLWLLIGHLAPLLYREARAYAEWDVISRSQSRVNGAAAAGQRRDGAEETVEVAGREAGG